jgi:hypothetical protein
MSRYVPILLQKLAIMIAKGLTRFVGFNIEYGDV